MSIPKTRTIAVQDITSIADLTEYIAKNCTTDKLNLFRGQREDYPLVPKIARINTKSTVMETESKMLSDLKRRSIPYKDSQIDNDWDWLSLAQHHGMATRLLDWTTNPLMALWFAVEQAPIEDHGGVVWIYKPSDDYIIESKNDHDPFSGAKPDHITKRIIAQGGWFTVHKYLRKTKDRPGRFTTLNELGRAKALLTKLNVPNNCFASLRSELDRCGVNSASVYPGLEGICQYIQWRHSNLDDE